MNSNVLMNLLSRTTASSSLPPGSTRSLLLSSQPARPPCLLLLGLLVVEDAERVLAGVKDEVLDLEPVVKLLDV